MNNNDEEYEIITKLSFQELSLIASKFKIKPDELIDILMDIKK